MTKKVLTATGVSTSAPILVDVTAHLDRVELKREMGP